MDTTTCEHCGTIDVETRRCVKCRRQVCEACARLWDEWEIGPAEKRRRITQATCRQCWDADIARIAASAHANSHIEPAPSFEELGCWGPDSVVEYLERIYLIRE